MQRIIYLSLFFFATFFVTQLSADTIYPDRIKIINGTVSEQPLSVLGIRDQSGDANNWESYQEINAVDGKSTVKYFFAVGSKEELGSQRVVIAVNRLGEAIQNEKWKVSIRNYDTGSYEKILLNSDNDWVWDYQEKTIGDISPYISSKGEIQIRISTRNGSTMDLDYLIVTIADTVSEKSEDTPEETSLVSTVAPTSTYNLQYNETDALVIDGFDMIDIDMEDTPDTQIVALHNAGKQVVCYISAGSWEDWRSDQASFPDEVLGNDMDGWDGERWLDISNIAALEPILAARMDRARAKGCDAVHPDNIDGYSNDTGFDLTGEDQMAYNQMLARLAHERGLMIGLKNDVGQIGELVASFDFAINESCYVYDECSGYSHFIENGKPVFIIEYQEDIFNTYKSDAAENGFKMILKNRNLDSFVSI